MSKYYKVIGSDNKSCHGGYFDWEDYLPKDGNPGNWTPRIENVVACKKGYHVTKYWNMWYEGGCRIFECEVDGAVVAAAAGVVDKVVCTRIRLCKETIPKFDSDRNTGNSSTGDYNTGDCNAGNCNTGDYNTGHRNTGHRNAGHYNTGDYNTGNSSTGDRNTGDHNAGNCNAGHRNTGHRNTGHRNTGDHNTGYYNTGDRNTGDHNAGHHNAGHRNAGNYNTGNYNTGDHNTCNYSSGFFNTVNDTIDVFNKPCKISVWERADTPDFIYFDIVGTYKESWRKAYDEAPEEDKLLLVKLPNFDADVFYEISGIMVDPKTGKEVI